MVFAVTSPSIHFLTILIMQTPNGESKQALPKRPTHVFMRLSLEQAQFLETVIDNGFASMAFSCKLLHDLLLYYSDVPIDIEEKSALHHINTLYEEMKRIED
jgi:hypothetical protein